MPYKMEWNVKNYKLELSSTRLQYKIFKNDIMVANGYSLNGKQFNKSDVETALVHYLDILNDCPTIAC